MKNLSLDSQIIPVGINSIGTQSLTVVRKQPLSVNTPNFRLQSALHSEGEVLPMHKHLSSNRKQPPRKSPSGKTIPPGKSHLPGYTKDEEKAASGASSAIARPKPQRSSDDPNSSAQRAARGLDQ